MPLSPQEELIRIACNGVELEGMLELPAEPEGMVLFAHGSGSSRLSPRNNLVARMLREANLGTLLVDLLTPLEDQDTKKRFDIALLTQRLAAAASWLRQHPATRALPLGLFGASTGAAAALRLAAAPDAAIAAVVSRGGRPDLAGDDILKQVRVPTLLIVGGLDQLVIELNHAAYVLLRGEKRLEIVAGATHLFAEPGTLETAAEIAENWFLQHMISRGGGHVGRSHSRTRPANAPDGRRPG